MISKTHEEFWNCYNALPKAAQKLARDKFHLWQVDAFHSSLQFKELPKKRLVSPYQSKLSRARTTQGQFNCMVLDWHACGV